MIPFRNNMPFDNYNPYPQQGPLIFNPQARMRYLEIQLDAANNRIRDLESQLAASTAEMQAMKKAEELARRKRLYAAYLTSVGQL